MNRVRGPAEEAPAPELVDAGFALEVADAPLLHRGLGLADLAHLLDLRARKVVPDKPLCALLRAALESLRIPAAEFPYDPAFGEVYNCRERSFVGLLGRRRRLAACGPPPPRGRTDRVATRSAHPSGRTHRGCRRVRRRCRGRADRHTET